MVEISDFLQTRIAPILSFSFLFPIFLLTTIVHEVEHAVVAFALGVRV